jgi:hypothetical protein
MWPISGFFPAGANADCQVTGSGVTKLVTYFRGLAELGFCAEYSPAWPIPDELPEAAPDRGPNCWMSVSSKFIDTTTHAK